MQTANDKIKREHVVLLYGISNITYCAACYRGVACNDGYCPGTLNTRCAYSIRYADEDDLEGVEHLVNDFNNTAGVPIATVVSCDGRQHECELTCRFCSIQMCINSYMK